MINSILNSSESSGLNYPPPFQFTGVTCATSNRVVDPFDVCLSSEAPSASPYLHFCIILAVTASLLSQRCYIFRGLRRQPIFYAPLWSCCSPLQAPAPFRPAAGAAAPHQEEYQERHMYRTASCPCRKEIQHLVESPI